MMFKKQSPARKQGRHAQERKQAEPSRPLTPEEIRQLTLEACCGCGMMLPGGCPDGIWYLY